MLGRWLQVGVAVLGELTAQRDAEDDDKRADGWNEEEIHCGPFSVSQQRGPLSGKG